jgi:hypothetical protein
MLIPRLVKMIQADYEIAVWGKKRSNRGRRSIDLYLVEQGEGTGATESKT